MFRFVCSLFFWKIGRFSFGMKFYICVLLLNRLDSFDEVELILLVRLIDGKNVVCVVLMLVLVDINVCLVVIIFGCCSSILFGMLVGSGCMVVILVILFCGSSVLLIGLFVSSISVLWFCVICFLKCVILVWVVFISVWVWFSFSVEVLFRWCCVLVRCSEFLQVVSVVWVMCSCLVLVLSVSQVLVILVISDNCVLWWLVVLVKYCCSVVWLRLCMWLNRFSLNLIMFRLVLNCLVIGVLLLLWVIWFWVVIVGMWLVCWMWYCVWVCLMLSMVMCRLWLLFSDWLIIVCRCGLMKKLCQLILVIGVVDVLVIVLMGYCVGIVGVILVFCGLRVVQLVSESVIVMERIKEVCFIMIFWVVLVDGWC